MPGAKMRLKLTRADSLQPTTFFRFWQEGPAPGSKKSRFWRRNAKNGFLWFQKERPYFLAHSSHRPVTMKLKLSALMPGQDATSSLSFSVETGRLLTRLHFLQYRC